jgi:hypothetical protein
MNKPSQPSFTQHPSADPTEGTGIRGPGVYIRTETCKRTSLMTYRHAVDSFDKLNAHI